MTYYVGLFNKRKTLDMLDEIMKNLLFGAKYLILLALCCGFLGSGMLKLVGHIEITEMLKFLNIPTMVIYLIGMIEILLSIAIFYQPTRYKGLLGVLILMTGAIGLHLIHGQWSYIFAPIGLITAALAFYFIEKIIEKEFEIKQ